MTSDHPLDRDVSVAHDFATDLEPPARLERAVRWLEAWDSQGSHRTATPGDDAGADWLAGEAERLVGTVGSGVPVGLGVNVEFESFAIDRVEPVEACVEVDGIRIDGVKMFDSPDTPIVGATEVRVVELGPFAVYSPEFRAMRTEMAEGGTSRALVVVTTGERPGLALLNAESFTNPFGVPVLQVASQERERLSKGNIERVVIMSRRVTATARNVVVTIPGTDPSLPPLVVMTPRSSWWQSTAERGGGLVCWLEVLRAQMNAKKAGQGARQTIVMTANTGHELGHIGLDDFLHRRSGWEQPGGAAWVHFGANIGATEGRLMIQGSSDDLRRGMADALSRVGRPVAGVAPHGTVPNGETRDIHLAGGRYVTLVGSNPLFHLPTDRWPHAVDAEAIARIASGAASFVELSFNGDRR